MFKHILAASALLALTACGHSQSNTADSDLDTRVDAGDVALYAIAPDGTRLWAVKGRGGRTVYFASSGTSTSHSETCGKNCTRTVDDVVPRGD